jgi:cyclopropane-fatty-acyl-phospholipid synthase
MVVVQIQMAKRKGVVPQTRDYIGREETRLRALEAGYAAPLRLAGE